MQRHVGLDRHGIAHELAAMFAATVEAFASTVTDEVRAAGPRAR
jgi:hypothetical protein